MTWIYGFLKFDSEQQATCALIEIFGADNNGNIIKSSAQHDLDIIGTLYRDDTGEAREGYHVNIATRGCIPESLNLFSIPRPKNPSVEYAHG